MEQQTGGSVVLPHAPRAIVTGAGGFIGSHLARTLADSGGGVVAVDLAFNSHLPGVRCVTRDVSVGGALDDLMQGAPGVLYHLAANANVPRSVEEPSFDLRHTFESVYHVLSAAREHRWRVVVPSSACVYDTSNPLPLSERAFVRPSSPYGAAKVAAEAYCYAFHRSYGLDVRIARLFNIYGEGMRQFVIHDVVRKLESNSARLELLGDGTQIRDYLFIEDAVRGLALIGSDAAMAGEDYNLASGEPVRILDLARRVAEVMGFPDVEIVTTGASWRGDIAEWYADASKISALGFRPEVDLETGLKRTVAWLTDGREHGR